MDRRSFVALLTAGTAGQALASRPARAQGAAPRARRIVVVGGGMAGTTCARFLALWGASTGVALDVTLVNADAAYTTCILSNGVITGDRRMEQQVFGYDALAARHGVRVLQGVATAVDATARRVTLESGLVLPWDRLVLAPGIDFDYSAVRIEASGYGPRRALEMVPHAWKAGPQTKLLKAQLEALEDGGLFVLSAPADPFRCPPGPYERVSLIAHYLKTHKPRSKILILDAKDAFSKQGLFTAGWQALYGDLIEWVGLSNDGKVVRVDAAAGEVETEFGTIHKAGVLNVIPPQKAGFIAHAAGVVNESGWVPVRAETFESAQVPGIHVVGDATIAAPMPKSGFSANAQGKVVAAAVVAALGGPASPEPVFANTCYSLVGPDYGISVAGVYRAADGKVVPVEGSGGLSPAEADAAYRRREARYTLGWYAAITQDIWGTAA